MKIAFIHNHRAFLPEIPAYQSFFQMHDMLTCTATYGEEEKSGADVYWYLMGYYPKSFNRKKLIIHEYASASVPPYRKIKDFLKSRINPRPHFRIYLNDYVRQQINIHDEVPFGYRDMGIADIFFRRGQENEKEFDFIYPGNLSAQRKLDPLLKAFDQGLLRQRSILLVGHDEDNLAVSYRHCKNIFFQPAVSWDQVPALLSRARYGINYIPDTEPFNAQTPTKFLEYLAMRMPVISTSYFWVSEFQERFGGNYFFLKDDLSNLSWERISAFPYAFPDLQSWKWDERIRASGVLEFLKQAKVGR